MTNIQGQSSPWGYGSVRSFYPSNLGGTYGSPSNPLPTYGANSAYYGYPGYAGSAVVMKTQKTNKRGCSFGGDRQLIANGVTTENSWGLNFSKSLRKKRKSRRKTRKSRKSRKTRKSRRKTRKSRRKTRRRSFGKCAVCSGL